MSVRRKRIEEISAALLDQHAITSAPIPVKRIARKVGARLSFQSFEDETVSGFVFRQKDNTVIGVNETHHPNRQRFTVAHELGHLLLEHPSCLENVHVDQVLVNFRDSTSSEGSKIEEKEANYFAACLLMPKPFIEEDVARIMGQRRDLMDERVVTELAKKYRVSSQALIYRLTYLGFVDEA